MVEGLAEEGKGEEKWRDGKVRGWLAPKSDELDLCMYSFSSPSPAHCCYIVTHDA